MAATQQLVLATQVAASSCSSLRGSDVVWLAAASNQKDVLTA